MRFKYHYFSLFVNDVVGINFGRPVLISDVQLYPLWSAMRPFSK